MDGISSINTAGKPIRCKVCWLLVSSIVRKSRGAIVIERKSLLHRPIARRRVVESIGEGVHEVVEGDTVIPIFMPDCGECADCLSEKSNLCTKLPFKVSPWMDREETSRFTDMNGEILHHFLFVSSFSEYTVVDIAHLTKIGPETPANRACLLSCGVSTGVGAAWKTAKVEAGTTVAIFGLGAIGLAV
ncbi:alcohol dehydrogenase-like 7 protein [Tanacetum coccineum]